MKTRVGASLFPLLTSFIVLLAGVSLLRVSEFRAPTPALAATTASAPVVEQVEPASVLNNADNVITVSGTDFAAVISGSQLISQPIVLLNEDALLDVGWVTSTTVTATVPAGYPVGVFDVTLLNPDGLRDTLARGLIVQYPQPQLAALHPVSGTYGQPLTLTLTGGDFVSPPLVFLGATPLPDVDYVGSTTLTARIPAGILPGYYDLTVQNPGPGDVSAWLADAFTLFSPVPSVSEVGPQKTYNDMDTPLVITGTNFAPTPEVRLGDTPLEQVTWISLTRLTAEIPWGMDPGSYGVTVVNPLPGGYAASLSGALTMTEGFNTWSTGGPYGGQIQELVYHPLRLGTLYALVWNVGVFASSDGGDSWEMILREDWLTHISFDAVDPQVIYIGGDGNLLRTMDGGLTWEEITPALEPWTAAWNLYRPLGDPTQGCVVYVGKRAPDEPEPEEGGIYRSNDCGTTWAKWGDENSGLTDTHVTDLAFHPANAGQMILGTQSGNIYRSDDAGRNWQWQAQVAPHIAQIRFNPFGAHEGWILTSPPMGSMYGPYVYTSTDLAHWTAVTVADGGGNVYPVHDLDFLPGGTVWAATGYGLVSDDGGATWVDAGWSGIFAEDNVRSFAVTPQEPAVIFAGHDIGGVYRSSDGGSTWQEANHGLAGVLPWSLALAPDDPDILYAYTTRGLLKSENGGHAWQSLEKWVSGPSGARMLAVDPAIPARVYLGQACTGTFCIQISEDAGNSWQTVSTPLSAALSDYEVFIEIIAPHPTQAGRLFASASFYPPGGETEDGLQGGLFVSDDHGEQWTLLATPEVLGNVYHIAYDAVDPYLMYVGTGDSGLWKSSNGGSTWQELIIPGLALPVGVESMATHPNRTGVLLARLLSFAETANPGGNLYISRDVGRRWTQLDEDTSDAGLTFAPPAPALPPYLLYTGCGRGACRSFDQGSSWYTIYGVPRPSSMVAGTDGERIVIYAGSPGGWAAAEEPAVAREGVGSAEVIPGRGSTLGSGVYRTTLKPLDQRLYLPLLTRP